jgi:sortase A
VARLFSAILLLLQTASRTRRIARHGARALLGAGLLALGYSAYVVIDAQAYQAIELRQFERDAAPHALPEPAAVAGSVIGELRISRLDLTAVVVQGDSAGILRRAVGHLAETALPGDAGNVVLAGHRDTFFRPLKDIRTGDVVTVRTARGDFQYVVESTKVVPPTDMRVLEPTGGHTLTLITCFPFGYLGAAPDRFIVLARELDAPRQERGAVQSRTSRRAMPPME